MKIWLVSHYAMPPHLEERVKTIRYAKYLQEMGHEVLLITASTIHNTDINLIEDKSKYVEKEYDGLKYVHIRCDQYKGSGAKRVLNLLQFQFRFLSIMKKFAKPDVIVADCNCINYYGINKFAKKYGIAFVSEIRDLWPLSIVEYKNMSNSNPIIKMLYQAEKRMYKQSNAIVFSMEGGKDYIIDKGWSSKIDLNKVFYINNGIDLEEQEIQRKENSFEDKDLDDDSFKIIYTGSIRTANAVDKLVKAAEELRDCPKIKFLLYGNGDARADLEQYCQEHNLTNIVFKGKVEKKYIPYILSKASLTIVSVMNTSISNYGVSWNKLFDYMNAGKPIISTVKVNYDIIEKNHCGISLDSQESKDIAKAIMQIYNLPKEEYEQMCDNAKQGVKEYDYKILTQKLENVMQYAIDHPVKSQRRK